MLFSSRRRLLAFVSGVLFGVFWHPIPAENDRVTSRLGITASSPRTQTVEYARPRLLAHLEDQDIKESSGLAASYLNPDLLWTHNDSGDGPYVYCVELDGGSCGVWSVSGAKALDWEDIAVGPGPQVGRSYLYLGDIGDNVRGRTEIEIYRVPEPEVSFDDRSTSRRYPNHTVEADVLRLRYEDTAHDAEALMVHPVTGDVYVVTKGELGGPSVFRATAPLDPAALNELQMVAKLKQVPGLTSTITGGAISPDGTRVTLANYFDAYEYVLPDDKPFDLIWRRTPKRLDIGRRRQGESITYRSDGRALLTTSEMLPTPLYEMVQKGYESSRSTR